MMHAGKIVAFIGHKVDSLRQIFHEYLKRQHLLPTAKFRSQAAVIVIDEIDERGPSLLPVVAIDPG
jgi:hypothetical protein